MGGWTITTQTKSLRYQSKKLPQGVKKFRNQPMHVFRRIKDLFDSLEIHNVYHGKKYEIVITPTVQPPKKVRIDSLPTVFESPNNEHNDNNHHEDISQDPLPNSKKTWYCFLEPLNWQKGKMWPPTPLQSTPHLPTHHPSSPQLPTPLQSNPPLSRHCLEISSERKTLRRL